MNKETNEYEHLTEERLDLIRRYWDDVDEAARMLLESCGESLEIGGETVCCEMKPGHVEVGKRNRWISHRSLHRAVLIERGVERIILWGETV